MPETQIPVVVRQMRFRDVLTALIYLKPGRQYFVEEALAHGVKGAFGEDPKFRWLFRGQANEGSCGATHTTLDGLIDQLHTTRISYTGDFQYCFLTRMGRESLTEMRQEYGASVFTDLRLLAQRVWERAKEYRSMHNRPELYA